MPPPIDMKRFEQLKAVGDLPSPRGVAIAIIRLTQTADVSMAELARVIKSDPAFVGRLIKAANGLVAENRRAVVSVQEALMVLGLPAVRTMALGFSLLSNYRKGACEGFDYGRFWSSSLLMALSMQALVQRVRVVPADEAFSLGLLARVGELALATLYPADFSRLLKDAARSPQLRQLDLEQTAFAMTHCELGAAMLADWGVPSQLVNPVLCFERPEQADFAEGSREAGLVQCLVLSRAIAQLCLAPELEQARLMPAMLRLSGRLGLPRGDFVSLCERIAREWGDWGKLLQIGTARAPAFGALCAAEESESKAVASPENGATASKEGGATGQVDEMPVLIVAADASERARMRALLEESGFSVHEQADCTQAIESAIDVQPRLLLIDWSGENCGAPLVRALRTTRFGRALHILVLLDADDDALLEEAAAAGADDFILRPIRPAALAVRLKAGRRTVMLQRELEREREELRHFAAELSISNRRLQEAAMTDALTGIPNRRFAIDRIQMEWAAAARHSRPLSVMIVDLDGFKEINDAHGHDVGDIALRQISSTLRGALRAQDVICRTGGDEFLVICPDTDLSAALGCAERLRDAAHGMLIETGGPRVRLTISVGVAMREPSMASADALIKLADRGAFLAKERGRNCVMSAQVVQTTA